MHVETNATISSISFVGCLAKILKCRSRRGGDHNMGMNDSIVAFRYLGFGQGRTWKAVKIPFWWTFCCGWCWSKRPRGATCPLLLDGLGMRRNEQLLPKSTSVQLTTGSRNIFMNVSAALLAVVLICIDYGRYDNETRKEKE